MNNKLFFYIILLISILCIARVTYSRTFFLSISGGDHPYRNQIAHEKNVQFVTNVFINTSNKDIKDFVYFSDGNDPGLDTCFIDDTLKIDALKVLLYRLFNEDDNYRLNFKNHQLQKVDGPARLNEIQNWFERYSNILKPDDTLYIYITDHGGLNYKNSNNNYIVLWDSQRLYVKAFAKLLQKINSQTKVILIMTQCYSGAFGNILWKDGIVSNKLNTSLRCGFFSSNKELASSGCSADINEENYSDYSTSFFTALSSHNRLGQKTELVDYNNDKMTQLIEAHYYAVLNVDTIDTPITTSEIFLRNYVYLPDIAKLKFDDIMNKASKIEKHVLAKLKRKCKLDNKSTIKHFIEKQQEENILMLALQNNYNKLNKEYIYLKSTLIRLLTTRYPVINNIYHPLYHELITSKGKQIIDYINSLSEYTKWNNVLKQKKEIKEEILKVRKRQALYKRFSQLIETVEMRYHLFNSSNKLLITYYKKLSKLEGSFF